ncbi:hypothetical protein BHM03_00056413 [Ensete ventricosum]|nr:hypothetical protein BHM03_00056413 [Ensete ventricosum]
MSHSTDDNHQRTRKPHLDEEGLQRENIRGINTIKIGLHFWYPRSSRRRRNESSDHRSKHEKHKIGARKHSEGPSVPAPPTRRINQREQATELGSSDPIILPGEHHVGGDDELDAGDVLDGEVVEESNGASEGADEEAEGPLEDDVLHDVARPPATPIEIRRRNLRSRESRGSWGGKGELVVEAFDGAEVGADDGDLGGGVGGGAANAGAVLVVIRSCGRDERSLEVVGVDELIGRHRDRLLGRSY